MSEKFIVFVIGAALLVGVLLVFRDRIPSPSVGASSPYRGPNGYKVAPLEAEDTFEVWSRPGATGRHYFCAAGRYAEAVLKADAQDRIEVISTLGPSQVKDGRQAVAFALRRGTEGVPGSDRASVEVVGTTRSVTMARRNCAEIR